MNDALRPKTIAAPHSLIREADAVGEFLDRYRDAAFRIAMRIVGNVDAAEDVAQDALVRAFKSWDRLSSAESQIAWVRKIAVRCALSAIERTPRHDAVPESLADSGDHGQAAVVQAVLETLPPDQRVLLGLVIGEGWSYKEIAEILDVPMGTVASRVHHAKAAFRKAWEDAQ